MNYFERFAPPLGSMQLIAWLSVFIVLPFFYAPVGLQFAVLTLAFIVGIQPHIDRLSEEGHRVKFAINAGKIFGKQLWKRREFSVRLYISNKKFSNTLATSVVLLFTFLMVPGLLYIVYKASGIFVERIDARWESIAQGLNSSINWAREIAPNYVPEGDTTAVFGGVFADLVGDAKHLVTEVSTEVATTIAHLVKAWFEIIIAMILLGVLVQGWDKETKSLKWRIEHGIENKTMVRRTFLFGRFYQVSLSVILVGYIEVAATLSVYYFLMLLVLPFNLSFGFIVTLALFFGFITAIPKIGGIATKVISIPVTLMLFPEQFGYFGYGFELFNPGVDLLVKTFVMFAASFFGGYLEAYEYTPEKIGKKLGITKMEMVMTILIWAIGAKFMGMIWGVLLMLLVPTFTKMLLEEKNLKMPGMEDADSETEPQTAVFVRHTAN